MVQQFELFVWVFIILESIVNYDFYPRSELEHRRLLAKAFETG